MSEQMPPTPWADNFGHVWETREAVACVECPHCLFTFAAIHTTDEGYECPNCDGCPDDRIQLENEIFQDATDPAWPSPQPPAEAVRAAAEEIADLVGFDVNVRGASGQTVESIISKHLSCAEGEAVELLREFVESPVDFDDERIRYVGMQVDRGLIERARAALEEK